MFNLTNTAVIDIFNKGCHIGANFSVGVHKTACGPATFAVLNLQGSVESTHDCPFDAAFEFARRQVRVPSGAV